MRGTKYNKAVREGLLYFKNTNEVFVLLSFLDRMYFENLMKQKKLSNIKVKTIITTYIDSVIEIYNLNMIYRGIKNKIETKLLAQFLVGNYFLFNEDEINNLLNQDNVTDFFDLIQDHKKIKEISKNIVIKREHFIWSLEGLYLKYFFDKFKIKMDDIDSITIFRIIEILIKKEKEIKFDILPHIVNVLHEKYELLDL
jgi:vacuolar-type H+-ATPase subunit C/Vma6